MNFSHRTNRTRRAAIGLAIAAATVTIPLALAGCSAPGPAASSTAGSGSSQDQLDTSVTIADSWAKATDPDAPLADSMSGVFGTLENTTGEDLTITGVSSEVAGLVELHEVVDGVMREIEGDVVIPAGGTYELAPGANHIMLMDLGTELLPGDEVPITLTFSDGSSLEFIALVKDTSGANESYDDLGHGDMDHGDMDHADMDHAQDDAESAGDPSGTH